MRLVLHALLGPLLAALTVHTFAAESAKLPRIGVAVPVDRVTDAPYQRALREGFSELGYVDGKNVVLVLAMRTATQRSYVQSSKSLLICGWMYSWETLAS